MDEHDIGTLAGTADRSSAPPGTAAPVVWGEFLQIGESAVFTGRTPEPGGLECEVPGRPFGTGPTCSRAGSPRGLTRGRTAIGRADPT